MAAPTMTIGTINEASLPEVKAHLAHLYEKSSWVTDRTLERNALTFTSTGTFAFVNLNDLLGELKQTFNEATKEDRLAVLRAHPDLVGGLVKASELTASSIAEQSSAGLDKLNKEEAAFFHKHNEEYKAKFGFPFIICVSKNKKEAIMEAMPRRLKNTVEQEFAEACSQVNQIAEVRLRKCVSESKL